MKSHVEDFSDFSSRECFSPFFCEQRKNRSYTMSFLLLKSRRNRPPAPAAPSVLRARNSHGPARSASRPAPNCASMGGGQMQQQIQRPKTTNAFARTKQTHQVVTPQQHKKQETKNDIQGVISMDEGKNIMRFCQLRPTCILYQYGSAGVIDSKAILEV